MLRWRHVFLPNRPDWRHQMAAMTIAWLTFVLHHWFWWRHRCWWPPNRSAALISDGRCCWQTVSMMAVASYCYCRNRSVSVDQCHWMCSTGPDDVHLHGCWLVETFACQPDRRLSALWMWDRERDTCVSSTIRYYKIWVAIFEYWFGGGLPVRMRMCLICERPQQERICN